MPDPTMMNEENSESRANTGRAGEAYEASQGPAGEAAQEPDPFVVLQSLQRENGELKDKVLRSLADMENLRRRTEKEIADAKIYGIASFARDMLTVADNLRRAVENVPTELRAEPAIKPIVEGIEVTERDFLSRLARYGVKKLEPLGAKFDPNMHEALYEVPDETKPNGTVVHVVEEGYGIGERVLRPAKVGISKGGPKPAN
jgi:molecular chaperone GrpE